MKIYLYCVPFNKTDVIGYAVAENGLGLASHLSSSVEWAKHDLGLTSTWKHEGYARAFPDGYELEWVKDPGHHDDLAKALELNHKRGMPEAE